MPRAIEIDTGARLHFGPLASGSLSGRYFGGIGMMIDVPAIRFRIEENPTEQFQGCSSTTIARIERLRDIWPPLSGDIPRRWVFESEPREHSGFGTGTQLSLAVTAALSHWRGEPILDSIALARLSGRGLRSAIGIHGFASGGFLVDAGQRGQGGAERIGDLAVRQEVPASWRILILEPQVALHGLSGDQEKHAFASLAPMSSALTDRLCRLTLMEILPALQAGDCDAFSVAVAHFGQLIGNYFSPVQGGVFASSAVRQLANSWPDLGRRLVQSSWGPAVAVICRDEADACQIVDELTVRRLQSDWRITIACPRNRGASIQPIVFEAANPVRAE